MKDKIQKIEQLLLKCSLKELKQIDRIHAEIYLQHLKSQIKSAHEKTTQLIREKKT